MAFDFLLRPMIGKTRLKMPKTTDDSTLTWMLLIKLGLCIAAAITAFDMKDVWEFTKKHPELSAWPYNENAESSYYLAYISCITIFPWQLVSGALLWKWHGPWAFLHGIVDFALGITFSVAVGMQGVFLPATANGCKGSKPQNWQVVDGHESFFTLVAEFKSKNATAVCKDYVEEWNTNVAVLFFQMLVAYIGIFFDGREESLLNPWRPLCWIFIPLFVPFVCFNDLILPKLHFYFRLLRKIMQCLRPSPKLRFKKSSTYHPNFERIVIENPNLTRVLTIEHILLDIASYSHYDDIVNLSLTSRAVREAVFPARDMEYRTGKLQARCCASESRRGCLYCNKRICDDCRAERFLPGLPGRRHLNTCVPYCRHCYRKRFDANNRASAKKRCRCILQDHSHELQDVCRSCANADVIKLQTSRHAKYVEQVREKALKSGADCSDCRKALGHGMRWWICSKCKRECCDGIHLAYVGKRKEGDVEKIGGDKEGEGETRRWWWSRYLTR